MPGDLLVNAGEVLLVFAAFVLAIVIAIFCRKMYYRFKYRKRYYIFPRMSVKGIANVAMVVAISVAVILLLTIVTAGIMGVIFRAYPGWRITIEGILIKIGGLLFGPVIGLFVGALTDLLAIALTAGAFHYGYFFAAMCYGLIAGLVRSLWNASKGSTLTFSAYASIAMGLVFAGIAVFISQIPVENNTFVIAILGLKLVIPKYLLILVVASGFIACYIVMWIFTIKYSHKKIRLNFRILWFAIKYRIPLKFIELRTSIKKDKQKYSDLYIKWYSKHAEEFNSKTRQISEDKLKTNEPKGNWFTYFLPVLVMACCSESVIEIFFLPVFDLDFSPLPYDYWIAFRSLEFLFMILLNCLVIFPVYRIVAPSMHYKYQDDLVEDLAKPLIVE